MPLPGTEDIIRRASTLYEQRLRSQLEASHRGRYLVIEPDSGDYALGDSMREAIDACRALHPARLSFVLRIGGPWTARVGGVRQ